MGLRQGLRICISYRLQADVDIAGLLTRLRTTPKCQEGMPPDFNQLIWSGTGQVISPSCSGATEDSTLRTQWSPIHLSLSRWMENKGGLVEWAQFSCSDALL